MNEEMEEQLNPLILLDVVVKSIALDVAPPTPPAFNLGTTDDKFGTIPKTNKLTPK